MEAKEHEEKWNAIGLSLVVNFVPSPADRGDLDFCCFRDVSNQLNRQDAQNGTLLFGIWRIPISCSEVLDISFTQI